MRVLRIITAAVLASTLQIGLANAIEAFGGGFDDADATVGADVVDANDVLVKPCDCMAEGVLERGVFRAYRQNGTLIAISYTLLEGTIITTTDGAVVGTIVGVENEFGNRAIVLRVRVAAGVLGTVDRINVRRNAFYWTGSAAVIDTTLADLIASVGPVGGAGA